MAVGRWVAVAGGVPVFVGISAGAWAGRLQEVNKLICRTNSKYLFMIFPSIDRDIRQADAGQWHSSLGEVEHIKLQRMDLELLEIAPVEDMSYVWIIDTLDGYTG